MHPTKTDKQREVYFNSPLGRIFNQNLNIINYQIFQIINVTFTKKICTEKIIIFLFNVQNTISKNNNHSVNENNSYF